MRNVVLVIVLALCACASSPSATDGPLAMSFTPVGSAFPTSDLIALEFLPEQGGEAIVISKAGTIFYMDRDFSPLLQTASIAVEAGGEQGLLNVVADPAYADNRFIYLYLTAPGGAQNQIDRCTVNVSVPLKTFVLVDRQTIIAFPKSDSPAPGANHNGGSMLFDNSGSLVVGVGDGGGAASADTAVGISQNPSTRLGKILRIVPVRTGGSGGFSIPQGGNNAPQGALPEIYSLGVRNPFTLARDSAGIFVGDVGGGLFEEIDLAEHGGLNFGWPESEGPTGNPAFQGPLLSYRHDDPTFSAEDPQSVPTDARAVIVAAVYTGPRYEGRLSNRLIYSDFYVGWIRSCAIDSSRQVVDDRQSGHLPGLTMMKQGPDGWLYAITLFGSDRILRVELASAISWRGRHPLFISPS